jgi:hypothetical protein
VTAIAGEPTWILLKRIIRSLPTPTAPVEEEAEAA